MSTPDAPDPKATASAQAGFNKDAAVSQQRLNMVDQSNPFGSINYTQSGTAPDGTPTFKATTTLSPEQQALYDQQNRLKMSAGDTAARLMQGVPTNTGATGIVQNIMGWGQDYLQPIFDQQNAAMETKLRNQGIAPGSEAYTNALRDVSRNQNDAYTNLLLQGQGTAMQSLDQQNRLPQSWFSFTGPGGMPNQAAVNTPSASIAAPNYAGLEQQAYQDKLSQSNGLMSGLFGLGGTVLGAAVGGPFGASIGGALGGSLGKGSNSLLNGMQSQGSFGGWGGM